MSPEELQEAFNAAVDARLIEHGLLTTEEAPAAAPAKGKGKGKAAEALDLDAMKAKFTALVEAKGKETAVGVLQSKPWGKAGIKLTDIDEKHYPKMAAAIDAAQEAEEDLFE